MASERESSTGNEEGRLPRALQRQGLDLRYLYNGDPEYMYNLQNSLGSKTREAYIKGHGLFRSFVWGGGLSGLAASAFITRKIIPVSLSEILTNTKNLPPQKLFFERLRACSIFGLTSAGIIPFGRSIGILIGLQTWESIIHQRGDVVEFNEVANNVFTDWQKKRPGPLHATLRPPLRDIPTSPPESSTFSEMQPVPPMESETRIASQRSPSLSNSRAPVEDLRDPWADPNQFSRGNTLDTYTSTPPSSPDTTTENRGSRWEELRKSNATPPSAWEKIRQENAKKMLQERENLSSVNDPSAADQRNSGWR